MSDVETVARAMCEAVLSDGEGNTYRLFDFLDFSGENKAHTVVGQLATAALAAATPLIEARVREECIAAVRGESFRRPPHSPRDEGYEHALTDAEAAIRKGRP